MKEDKNGALRISWTQLLRLETCVRQAKLHAAGKREKISNKRNFFIGNVTDRAMRAWLEEDNPQVGGLKKHAKQAFNTVMEEDGSVITWRDKDDQKNCLESVMIALERLEPWLLENVIPYEYEPEARGTAYFTMTDQYGKKRQIAMFYAVDIAVKRPEGWWLIDLKSTKNKDYVKGKTLGQLTYYSIAWAIKFGLKPEDIWKTSFITPLIDGNFETTVSPTQTDFSVMLSRIQKYAYAFWDEKYSPTKKEADYECRNQCDVRRHCPLGQAPKPNKDGKVNFMDVVNQRKEMGADDGRYGESSTTLHK